ERGPWIESVTVVDLGVEPPAVVWEIVLPKEKRDEAWGWDPKTPWTVRLGKAPGGFRETAPLKKPLETDNLYQVSLLGWDPGEMVFAVEPKTKKITYYDENGKVLPEPSLPCAK
ncbi:MAG: hypothetical protein AB1405_17400, partial [Bdellovibrionota bacterium]